MASLREQEKINASLRLNWISRDHMSNSKAWLRKTKSHWYEESEQGYYYFVHPEQLKISGGFDLRLSIPQVRQRFIRSRLIIDLMQKSRIILQPHWDKESLSEEDILRSAWELTNQLTNKEVAEESKHLLSAIKSILYKYRQSRTDLSSIPQLSSFLAEDGSILFEWIFNDYRIGFSIETNLNESSWYLITTKNLGGISASGSIHDNNLHTSIPWLLNFILSQSSKR